MWQNRSYAQLALHFESCDRTHMPVNANMCTEMEVLAFAAVPYACQTEETLVYLTNNLHLNTRIVTIV
jgi:hypothetical protein